MDFLNDRAFISLIKKLRLRKNWNDVIMPYRLFFVCGGQFNSQNDSFNNRRKVKDLIDQHDKCLSVFAEDLYFDGCNLLEFENLLADICDNTIVIPESPGSFCELGAFVNNSQLRNTLIVFNNDNPKYSNSFISKGPLKMIPDRVIPFEGDIILDSRIRDYINKLTDKRIRKSKLKTNNGFELRTLMCILVHLLYMFEPISSVDLEKILVVINNGGNIFIKSKTIRSVNMVVKLMQRLGFLEYYNDIGYCLSMKVDKKDIKNGLFLDNDEKRIRMSYLSFLYKHHPEVIEKYDKRNDC